MLNEAVINVLKNGMWDLATWCNGEPNVVPSCLKGCDGGRQAGGREMFLLETTLNNIRANGGKIAISAYDAQSLEGYQIKGTAEYVTEELSLTPSRRWSRRCSTVRRLPRVP